jgi:hypothetical protein
MQARHVSLLLVMAACADRSVTAAPPLGSGEQVTTVPISVSNRLDLLFVIDDSASMGEEQELLAANFPRFIDELYGDDGQLPDLHIGVVSSDLGIPPYELQQDQGDCLGDGKDGVLLRGPAGADCGLTGDEPYLVDSSDPDGAIRNYPTGELARTFECMAKLGTNGCGFERHLEAMERALTDQPRNDGFLRDDAVLAIVFIADEDDCSAADPDLFDPEEGALGPFQDFRCFEQGVVCEGDDPRAPGLKLGCRPREDSDLVTPVSHFVDAVRALKGDPRRIVVAGILGDAEPVEVEERADDWALVPSCETAGIGKADPAVRLRAFLDGFPGNSTAQTICPVDEDLSGAMTQIGLAVRAALPSFCIAGDLADGDPDQPGVQPVCSVSDVVDLDRPGQHETLLGACDTSDQLPCYRVIEDAEACTHDLHLKLEIDRAEPPAPETTVVARCQLR